MNTGRGVLSLGLSVKGVKLTAHLRLVPTSRMVELYLHSPTRIYGMVFNYQAQGQLLPILIFAALHPGWETGSGVENIRTACVDGTGSC